MPVGRIVIDDVHPSTPTGYPAKAVVGERVPVTATIFRDGHDHLGALVRWRAVGDAEWTTAPLRLVNAGLDQWEGFLEPTGIGPHELEVEAWTDRVDTWRHHVEAKAGVTPQDGQDLLAELAEGARHLARLTKLVAKAGRARAKELAAAVGDESASLDTRIALALSDEVGVLFADIPDPIDRTRGKRLGLWVDRPAARHAAWYELFPRSEGGFEGAMKRLPAVAAMGFDVVYLPPVHPIGHTARKGPGNTLGARPDDPGSPWAIGSEEGGHTAVHPDLGTIEEFDRFVAEAESNGLEVALDYALQCSPDHPWVREHPEWFQHRPDGTIKYAENPPKKYQDIYPLEFWPADEGDRKALWTACRRVLEYWMDHGVRTFRVDNPHTKPLAFWEWLIGGIHADHPDVVFLAEAFTRPAMMAKLAAVGFTQSYTYFTWRTTRAELEQYVTELAHGPLADYMRPSFWPNTPDILSGPLRDGPPAAFRLRFLLAATLSPLYGMYSGYELCENQPASPANEEYHASEKFEVKVRDWEDPSSLAPFITRINDIRRRHPALAELRTITFHETGNDSVIAYSKLSGVGDDPVLCIVNLDPWWPQEAVLALDLPALGLDWDSTYQATDELTGDVYTWAGGHPYVRLDPGFLPGHVLSFPP